MDPAVRDEYRRMLVMYEGFVQKRNFAKLVKLAKDKASLTTSPNQVNYEHNMFYRGFERLVEPTEELFE